MSRRIVHNREYEQLMAFIFAVDEVNRRSDLLPNVTLGYQVFDSCGNINKVINNVLHIMSGIWGPDAIPNYSYKRHDKLVGYIGDLHPVTTNPMAQLLSIFGYTQISYGARDPLLGNKMLYPNFFRTVQNYEIQHVAIAKLIKSFGWNWVGILTTDDDPGEREAEHLSQTLSKYGICKEFEVRISLARHRPYLKKLKSSISEIKTGAKQMKPFKFQHKIPAGSCSAACFPGTRRSPKKSYHSCCHDCIPCSEGHISNISDSKNCQKCPEDQWPNEEKDECIPKLVEFLSYEQDMLAAVFSSMSGLFLIITSSVSAIFLLFLDTPIVKANNQNISFILLLSLKFSLLCMFLFIGRPDDITCMLRQISIGVTFTVAVSSILAKTIMVSIAFKATRPGSSWRKWLGVKLPHSVVLICSLIQFLNGIIWLSISSPFQEMDIDSYPGKIIIQCNEGSVVAFYFMLGYLGVLAAVSFMLAFMVRTLPDIFNEAKYITFSMLVFCSVWICAIPAYVSSKGKSMVSVEIFSILASEFGILSCIFFPKCYNIIMRPEVIPFSIMAASMCDVFAFCVEPMPARRAVEIRFINSGKVPEPEDGGGRGEEQEPP
ncbi:vomeronasal type-2 receptor 26-like [Bufo gargarizans]|uniref:vomeronasal type-2 receptor 26-like n=1 Tax=Bufo gargarizans TaxID=30331 RepID=UPI001CF4B735|nr:vomeronasal type-2 receptor 26-like [Bufo gargarizans]